MRENNDGKTDMYTTQGRTRESEGVEKVILEGNIYKKVERSKRE